MKRIILRSTLSLAIITLLLAGLISGAHAEEVAKTPGGITEEKVRFANEESGLTLSGILFTSEALDRSAANPAVIVTGPMLSVKEQAQSIYARRLAAAGYVTMVFDYSYFGESQGEPRSLEVPDIKAGDIHSAVSFLQSLDYVDADRIGGIGICGSGSYMPFAAVSDERIKAVVSVVPAIVMDSFLYLPIEQAQQEKAAYEADGTTPSYIDLMPQAYAEGAAYYYNKDRGWRDNWSNLAVGFSELSWADFHPAEWISQLKAPYLVITSTNAWTRSGAEAMYNNAVSDKEFHMVEGAGHFDMYDLEPYVTENTEVILDFFGRKL